MRSHANEVYDLVLSSEIRDSMTVIAVLHAARQRDWGAWNRLVAAA
jgi:hypothetical protein